MDNAPAVLQAIDVSIRYRDSVPVIQQCSFSVYRNQRIALFGLNGSGKSTLLFACAGLIPHSGEIYLQGERLGRNNIKAMRRQMGFLFSIPDDQLLFTRVIDDVSFAIRQQGVDADTAHREVVRTLVSLGAEHLLDRSVHELSYGQRLRVALAGALIHRPALLLLDEPSAGLDPPGKRKLAAYLEQADAAMLVATHDYDFARHFCTGYLLLNDGRIIRQGSDLDEMKLFWEY